jgi:hypothetical protein
MGHMDSFKWMILNTVPKWYDIENTLSYLKKVQLSEAEVFDQFVCLKTFVSTNLVQKNVKAQICKTSGLSPSRL